MLKIESFDLSSIPFCGSRSKAVAPLLRNQVDEILFNIALVQRVGIAEQPVVFHARGGVVLSSGKRPAGFYSSDVEKSVKRAPNRLLRPCLCTPR